MRVLFVHAALLIATLTGTSQAVPGQCPHGMRHVGFGICVQQCNGNAVCLGAMGDSPAVGRPEPARCPPGVGQVACPADVDPCEVTRCPAHPDARCRADYCGGCNAAFYDSDGNRVECDVDEVTFPAPPTCPPDEVFNCFANPCDVTSCPAHPDARCQANYCGGCNAEFFDEGGNKVVCNETEPPTCPPDVEVLNCFANPCDVTSCPAHPAATCQPNYCGGCNAEFFDEGGEMVHCDDVVCAENSHFDTCGHGACQPTCENPAPICTQVCIAGCQCDDGFALHDGQCISMSQCESGEDDLVPVCNENTEPMPGQFVKQCEEDGSFSTKQCHGSSGFCYCAHPQDGTIYRETGRRGEMEHDCQAYWQTKGCGENSHFDTCGHGACQPTCENPAPICAQVCIAGCQCDDGFALHDGQCIPMSQCEMDTPENLERRPCPPGVGVARCLRNPCDTRTCPGHPNATCQANYCGGCNAEFFDEDGNEVECEEAADEGKPGTCPPPSRRPCSGESSDRCEADSDCPRQRKCCQMPCGKTCVKVRHSRPHNSSCPPGVGVARCLRNPCERRTCPGHPNATCQANYCGGCNAEFFDEEGNEVDCGEAPIPERPGICPAPAFSDDQCLLRVFRNCSMDANCRWREKCCFNGCQRTCVRVRRRPPRPNRPFPERPGTCPARSLSEADCSGPRLYRVCTTDMDCTRVEKCCDLGCGQECVRVRGRPSPDRPFPERPGTCPTRSLSDAECSGPRLYRVCTTDMDCTRVEKCCDLGCGQECVRVRGRPSPDGQTPGTCPAPLSADECLLPRPYRTCRADGDCSRGEKCCDNGCGGPLECKRPMRGPMRRKPGTCPAPERETSCRKGERSQCDGDPDCPGRQKCCSDGCVMICQNPAPTSDPETGCLAQLQNTEPMPGQFVKQCEEDGSFSTKQCHGSTGFCYCAHPQDGTIYRETGRRGEMEHDCQAYWQTKEPETGCLAQLTNTEPMPGKFVKQCEEDGSFSTKQCHGSSGFCYCAHPQDGTIYRETGRRGEMEHDCQAYWQTKDPETGCLAQLQNTEPMPGQFVKQCEEDGSFSTKQCHGSTGFCYCAHPQDGTIYRETGRRGEMEHDCQAYWQTKEPETECQAQLQNTEPMPGQFVKQCEEDGSFSTKQCHGSSGFCYCAHPQDGTIYRETGRRGEMEHDCQTYWQTKVCGENSHFDTCGHGACQPTCENPAPICTQVCIAGCQCDDGFALHDGQCIPMSQCESGEDDLAFPERPGTCPARSPSDAECSGPRLYRVCTTDVECHRGEKCCDNGCGVRECIRLNRRPMRRKPGTCPAPSPLLTRDCSRGRRNQCEGDFECPLRQKCCLDGCVKVCQNPTPRIGPGRRRPILSDRTDTEMTAEPDIAGVTAAFRQHDIVPDVVDAAPTIAAEVTYNVTDEDVSVDFGNVLTPTQVKSPPQVMWPVEDGALYTLVMTDPDAPSRANPRLREFHHWLVGNIPGNEIQDGETLSQYIGSAPPRGRGLHRYVFLVYKQPGTLEFDERRLGNTSMAHRSRFHTREFATKYNLGDPVAGNFYQAEWDDWVPRLYAAMAQ
ncbi:uncharacterized protein LOC144920176 isoform X5 [Branchiostoma floridae x Branchiostoma belcheri]